MMRSSASLRLFSKSARLSTQVNSGSKPPDAAHGDEFNVSRIVFKDEHT